MRYLIIGLGIYGSNLALDLTAMGHEIIGVDIRKANTDAIKDYISTVYHIDATEESSLSLLPLNNVDLVIVAIGENFGASIKVVAMLKKYGVKHIYARAIDKLHESILQGFNIDRIITPEQRAARDLSNEMALGVSVQTLEVDDDQMVMKFRLPKQLVGLKYSQINFEKSYGLKLIAVTRCTESRNIIGINHLQQKMIDVDGENTVADTNDTLVCLGTRKSYNALYKQLKAL